MQAAEAEQEALDMLVVYTEFASQMAAIPVVAGRKSAAESFAGAVCTYTIEAMMSDRRALQVSSVLWGHALHCERMPVIPSIAMCLIPPTIKS